MRNPDALKLSWPEVAKAISPYICAKYDWTEGSFFELTPQAGGVLIERVDIVEDVNPNGGV